MNITLRQLRYFVEIAQSRSFSRAAERLRVAQPALSQNISSLEDSLGAKLFERHARGVEISPAGERLLTSAIDILARTDALKDDIDGRASLPTGSVRLSIAGSIAGAVIAPLLGAVAREYPGIEVTVRESMSFESRALVESGQAHLALMPSPSEIQGMASIPLYEERFMLYGTRAAMRRKPETMTFAEVAELPLAAPDGAHDLRKIIERAANAIGRSLDVRYELNSPQMLIALARDGLAYVVMPPSACLEAVAAKSIVGRPVTEPDLTRIQALVWPGDRPLSPAAAAIRDLIAHIVGDLVERGALPGRTVGATYKKK
ncbi:LysR substrate-binding domain-containing protein [Cupriavidus necator]|uniref:Transcriptional regulator, LysR family n=1 Tax=Cupriavidus pinatubonensis (strain JMP 134 / LMG 1197) TaxID=264198 RepID=Q46P28_CUPPJ|nr:LysR substrate-binding domain-containing protein [Cupriavidus necator]